MAEISTMGVPILAATAESETLWKSDKEMLLQKSAMIDLLRIIYG
jgi:hypothetical protein